MTGPDEVKIIKGNPTDEEIAAVVIALSTLTTKTPSPAGNRRRPEGWAAYWRNLRTPLHPSPNAWRTSLRGS